jgi:hypothetical protein
MKKTGDEGIEGYGRIKSWICLMTDLSNFLVPASVGGPTHRKD